MNVVPFLCPMALNLHQKRPSPVTFGWLFHRAIRHEIAAPSFVLMRAGAAKLPPSSVIPPRHTTRKRSAIIRFDGDGAAKLPRHPPFHRTIRRETVAPSFVLMAMVQGNYPRHPSFHRAIRREIASPSSVLMAMAQGNYPRHPSFHRAMQHETVAPSFVLMGDGARKLPPWGLYF